MTDGDEYIYRLGIDYRDLQKALDNVLTLLGKVDQAGLNLPTSFEKGATRASGAVATLAAGLKKAAGTDITSATKKQNAALQQQASAIDKATAAYARYQTNLARIAAGEKVARPGANSLPANISTTQLKALSAAATSLKANGQSLGVAGNGFIAQVNAEIAARANAATKRKADDAAAIAATQEREKTETALVAAGVAERVALATREAQAFATAHASGGAQARSVKAAQDASTAAVEAGVQARVAAGQREIAAADEVARQIQAARQRGNLAPTQIVSQRSSDTIFPTYRPVEQGNARNTASANVMTYAQQAQSTTGNGAALAAHLADQQRLTAGVAAATLKANAATDRFNNGLRSSYQRTLPSTAYALSAVSRSVTAAGAALLAAGAAPLAVAANYQDLYAQVERTSSILTSNDSQASKNSQYAVLRQDLVDLSKQIPVTFADITKIATLGNQLGIPSADIANFTRTVAEFSATTDVDVESAAEAFGRLGQLLDNTDYKQIGDQIAYLGVKSVATESEIIDTTTQLAVSLQSLNTLQNQSGATQAASSAQIKQTTAATLALSTTVAGLGVKPEQARGTFIRTFGAIGAAVASGGAQLNDLARISGTTSAAFAKNWSAGGGTAYQQFLDFTQGLGSNTAEINANLASIGIRAVRDRQTLGLLNQNGDRAAADYANANKGSKNNFLDTAFAVQSQTVLKQLQVLGQQVTAVFDEVGSSADGPLAFILQRLQGIVGFLDSIEHNKTAATFLAIGAALSIVAGVILLGIGGLGRYASSLVYLQILLKDVSGGSSLLSSVWAGMTGNAIKAAGGTGVLTQALAAEGVENDIAAGAAGRAIAALEKEAGTGAKTALSAEALTEALAAQGIEQDQAAAAALRTTAVVGTTGGAFVKGAAAASRLGAVVGKVGLAGFLISLVLIIPSVISGIKDIANAMIGATPDVDTLTKSIENFNNKSADQAKSTVRNGFQAFGTAPKPGYSVGADGKVQSGSYVQGQFIKGTPISAGYAAVNQANIAQDTKKGQTLAPGADVDTASKELTNADTAIANLFNDGNTKGANLLLGQLRTSMAAAGVPTKDLEQALTKTRAALGATGDESLATAQKEKGITDAATDAADAQDAFNSSLSDLFDPTTQALAISKDFEDIGAAVKASGAQVGLNGSEMQKAISDIYASSSDMPTVKGRLQSLLDQLSAKGYTPAQLSGLQGAIYQITGATADAKVDIDGFNQGLAGTGDTAEATARTLTDYGSDLASVFSRTYDLRFGNQDALDKITSGWKSLTSSISDSRDELKKAKADLAALQADKGVTEYQLGVAEQFGDTARAATLRAQLAQNNSDIADKKKDVAKDTTATSRALTGNSAGAISNRAGLEGQIQSSAAYVQSVATNGGTAKQIQAAIASQKKQFIDQATAAGFSRKEVLKMAKAYDDMRDVVKAVPKNVTTNFKAHTTAAQKAIAEYNESLKGVTGTKTTTIKVAYTDLSGDPLPTGSPIVVNGTKAASDAIRKKQAQLGFRDGGYTGDGPAWQAAGVVHKGEMVLNQRATTMFPRAMLDGANHGVAPVIPTVNATATLGSGATMSLGTTERRLLARAGQGGGLSIRGDRIAQAFDEEFKRANRRGQN